MKSIFRLCLLLTFIGAGCGSPTVLVNNGASEYSVVTPANPSAQERRAAALLQKYVEKMSGYKLPIVTEIKPDAKGIFIKEVDGLKFDGYRVKTAQDGSIHIEGGKSKGCIYGAILILDKYLGCHLYSPKYAVIPTRQDLRLPAIDEADSSVNSLRIAFTTGDFSNDEDLLDWNRTCNRYPPFADGYYCHTLTHKLVPIDSFYKTHPEYFAYINGHRVPDQVCMSDTNVLREVIKQLKKDMPLQPDRLYWSVSQADGELYCQCDKCKKAMEEEKSPSGPIMRFVNQVAKEFPDKIITTLAYNYSAVPPAITRPADNVQIMFCAGDLAAWGKIAKHIYVWDYVVDYFHYQCPYPSLFQVQPQVQDQVKKGADQFFIQANIDYGMEFAELRLYLISRIAWNPNIDVSATINDFLKAYYGDAAPYIRKYIDRLTAEYDKTKHVKKLIINTPPTYYQDTYLSAKNRADYNAMFDEAEKAVQGNDVFAQHVHLARMPLNFAEMEIAKHSQYGPQGWWDSTGTIRNKRMDTLFEDFYNTCKRSGIVDINENAYTIELYKKYTQYTTSNEALIGNLAFHKKVTVDKPLNPKIHRYYNADMALLTDGVRGDAATRNLFWLIWPDSVFTLTLDLGDTRKINTVDLGAQWGSGTTIPPASVECSVSQTENGAYTPVGKQTWNFDQKRRDSTDADWRYDYVFKANTEARFVKLKITRHDRAMTGRKAGMPARTFLDEIEVR